MSDNLKEQLEASALRVEITQKKADCYDVMKMYIELGDDKIKQAGYPSVGEALNKEHINTGKRIEKMIRAHEAKYPG